MNKDTDFFTQVHEKQVLATERARQIEAAKGNTETAHLISISWLPKVLSICFSAYHKAPKRRYVLLTKAELFMPNEEWAVYVQSVALETIYKVEAVRQAQKTAEIAAREVTTAKLQKKLSE